MNNLQLDDFIHYEFLSGIQLSPDGKYACFAVHKQDLESNGYHSNLWLYPLDSNKPYKLTTFNKENSFLWQEDGKHLLFQNVRDGKDKERLEIGETFTTYYRININGGEAEKYMEIPKKVTALKELDENTFLLTAIYDHNEKDLTSLSAEEKAKELKKKKEEEDYQIIEEIPFWSNGTGFTNMKRNRLYLYDVTTKKYRAVSAENHDVTSFSISPDKKKVVFITNSFDGIVSLNNGIYLYDIETETTITLLEEGPYACDYVDFTNDTTLLFVGTEQEVYGINENRKLYQLEVGSKEVTCLTPELDASLHNSVGSDCRYGSSRTYKVVGDYFYFVTTEGGSSFLHRLHIKDRVIEKVTTTQGSVDGFDVWKQTILFIGLRDLKLQELYRVMGQEEQQLTSFNKWVLAERKLSSPEAISFQNSDGITIDGWVLKPVDYDDTKKYPGILDIHGGPKTVYGTVMCHEMQYWANEGYFVLFCNPRGSDGKGNEFADIRGKYGTIDYEDLMGFTDKVLEKYPSIDHERIGVTGGSYGGFMTNWIIGHTNRFKAAASQRSISNWISKFGTTDIGFFFVDDQQGGTPWNNAEKLWWHSPMKYADKVATPTLFLHSDEDYRCWIPEAYQMFTSLKYHGIETRLCVFKGENHELSRSGKPKHRIKRLQEITNWFNKYLK